MSTHFISKAIHKHTDYINEETVERIESIIEYSINDHNNTLFETIKTLITETQNSFMEGILTYYLNTSVDHLSDTYNVDYDELESFIEELV